MKDLVIRQKNNLKIVDLEKLYLCIYFLECLKMAI